MATKIIPKGDTADKLVDTASRRQISFCWGQESEEAVDFCSLLVWFGVSDTSPVRYTLSAASEYDQ